MPQDLPRNGFGYTGAGAKEGGSCTDGLFSGGVRGRCAASTSSGNSSSGSSDCPAVVPRRARRTVDFLLMLCSTMSVSFDRFTTLWEISRNIEFALAIGEGEGERDPDRDRSPDVLDDTSSLLMPLAELSLRLIPEPVSNVGKSSPRREVRPRPCEGDSPSIQCTLDLFDRLSCRCPLLAELEGLTEACSRLLSVRGVVSLSGGEKRASPSLSTAGVVIIVGRRSAEGGVAGERRDGAKSSANPMEAEAKSCALGRGERSPEGDPSRLPVMVFRGSNVSREGDSASSRE